MAGNWIDNLIGFVSPIRQVRRLQAKMAIEYYSKSLRKFEGAGNGRRMAGWQTSSTSASAELVPSLTNLRNRSRDLVRNNCYAKSGITDIETNVVGTGIITQVKSSGKSKAQKIDGLFHDWAEESSIDFDGRCDVYGLQSLVMRTVAESGECLIRRRRTPSSDGLAVPIQLQVLEGDYLDGTQFVSKSKNGNTIIQGIEYDARGRRVAYHLYEQHPGDLSIINGRFTSNRIPAEEVLHIYDIWRSGQIRGVPWLAAAIVKLRDLDEYEDAQLVRQKIAACFSAFVHDADFDADPGNTNTDDLLGSRVEPGLIEHLPPGKEITFGNPPSVSGFKEFTSANLMAIASSLGITYESMTGDYSQVNFSSARMGWLKYQRNITNWQNRIIIAQFMRPIFRWFVEAANISGVNASGCHSQFTVPRREMIDPTKEIPALVKAMRAGMTTLPEVIKMYGNDWMKQLEEIKESNDMIDKLELILDSDPRKTQDSGKTNDAGNNDGGIAA